MNPEPNEYRLAQRARSGDREALTELIEQTRMRLFSLAYAELRHYEDAQDAVAAALLQICCHVHELREPERVRAWMQSIVRNEVRRLRQSRAGNVLSLDDVDEPTGEERSSILRLDIEQALLSLPGDQARALQLFYLSDLSIREIAERFGRSEGTIKSWLHRGRRHLAHKMEVYAPMSASSAPNEVPLPPLQPAAIIQTDLDADLIPKIDEALTSGHYLPISVQAEQREQLMTAFRDNDTQTLDDWLKFYRMILLDEWIEGRSAFEFILNLRAYARSRGFNDSQTRLCLLCDDPSNFTALSAFNAGVDLVINKKDSGDLAKLSQPFKQPWPQSDISTVGGDAGFQRFTERTRKVIFFSQQEAAQLGENSVNSEHLLLGLMRERDHVAARILERLGISFDAVETEARKDLIRGAGHTEEAMMLTSPARNVIDLAYEESRLLGNNYLGTEHLLLGLIRESEGQTASLLNRCGVHLDAARQEVRKLQFEAVS